MDRYIALSLVLLLTACTSVDVRPVDASYNLLHVCVEKNPKVIVPDFVSTLEDAFLDHGIETNVYNGLMPDNCEYKLTYTALRSWDFSTYLSHAELRLYKGSERIGYAEYHLNGGGGLSLMKWASVKSKMTPVVDDLLSQY